MGRYFWGKEAAGVLIQRASDGRLLLLHRHGTEQSGTWGVPGGRVDSGLPIDTARQEAEEEVGGLPKGVFVRGRRYTFSLPLTPDEDTYELPGHRVVHAREGETFTYTTYLYRCDDPQWEPELNWEHDDWRWMTREEALAASSVMLRDERGAPVYPVRQMLNALPMAAAKRRTSIVECALEIIGHTENQ